MHGGKQLDRMLHYAVVQRAGHLSVVGADALREQQATHAGGAATVAALLMSTMRRRLLRCRLNRSRSDTAPAQAPSRVTTTPDPVAHHGERGLHHRFLLGAITPADISAEIGVPASV
jgi:hypothetical protein